VPVTHLASDYAADEVRIFSLLRDTAGFDPKVIFDIGASNGEWSRIISEVFPNAVYHLFEPLAAIRQTTSKPWNSTCKLTQTSFFIL
jgi:hypothetical protein